MSTTADPLTVIAFVVSLAAFVAASLQVIQQYAATAYHYNRCSRRTIGGWAKYTKRRFIWAEVRFEITYSVPHISLDFENIGGSLIPSQVYPTYSFAPILSRRIRYKWEDNPWFLRARDTTPEARCSWLSLLGDTNMTILPFHITEQRRSYDFLPRDFMRPIATADRKSFLVLMTLLRVKWNGRGAEGGPGGGAFLGTGPHCEISATYVPSFGTVYTYHRREPFQKYEGFTSFPETPLHLKEECLPVPSSLPFFRFLSGQGEKMRPSLRTPQPSLRYSLPKFWRHWLHMSFTVGDQQLNAVQSMFNHFDLSFMILRTWSSDEVHESLLRAFSDHKLASMVIERYPMDGFYPGLGELVACWGYPSTPRVVDPLFGTYASVYSASDLGCALGIPLAASILLGNETQLQGMGLSQYEPLNTLREWSTRYWHQLLVPADHMFKCRAWVSQINMNLDVNILHDVKIDVKTGDACLELIEMSDMELTRSYPSAIRHRDLARCILQVYSQSNSESESQGSSAAGLSTFNRVILMAKNVIKVVEELSKEHPEYPEEEVQMIVINRLLRGVLWTIRNGNAPGNKPSKMTGEDRSFECSLSSRILDSTETIYIS